MISSELNPYKRYQYFIDLDLNDITFNIFKVLIEIVKILLDISFKLKLI